MNEQQSRPRPWRYIPVPPASPAGRLALGISLLTILPIWWGAVVAVHAGWWPIEDDARTILKVQDLLAGHLPMLGTQAAGSGAVDPLASAHHLGPIEYYLVAPFVATLGGSVGLLVALAVLHTAFVVLILRAGWLLGRLRLLVPLSLACLVLAQGDSGFQLFQPINTIPAVYALLLVPLAATMSLRRPRWLIALVFAWTVAAQAQLAYVPVLTVIALVAGLVGMRQWHTRRGAWWPLPGPVRRRPLPGPGWGALGLLVLMWMLPVWESLTFEPGNASQLHRYVNAAQSEGGSRDTDALALRFLASAIPIPQWPNIVRAVLTIGLLALLISLGRRASRRQGSRGGILRSAAEFLAVLACTSFIAEVVILTRFLPAGPTVWTDAYWVTPIRVFGLLVWATVAWLGADDVTELLRRRLSAGVVRRAVQATCALLLAWAFALAVHAPTTADFERNRVMNQVGDLLQDPLRATVERGDPVRVTYTFGFRFNPVTALTYRLMDEGYFVCNDQTWPVPEETDYRAWDRCPRDAVTVVVTQSGQSPEDVLPRLGLESATYELVGSTDSYRDSQGNTWQFDVYLALPGAPPSP
ncbi:hypothetical protein [Nocardioides sp.]|uniref:hypothetical protein n=1 Tax=Nocardioides sp. TaxID=35761 RepID=UPI003528026F